MLLFKVSNSPRITWSGNKTFIAMCLEYESNNSSIYKKVINLMLAPQLKPTIDIDMLCFLRSGVFGIYIKAPWFFCNMPLEVVA